MALPRSQWPSLVSSPRAKGRLHRGWGGCGQHGSGLQKVCLLTGPECFCPRTPGHPSPGAWLSPWASTRHRAVGASLVQQIGAEDKA